MGKRVSGIQSAPHAAAVETQVALESAVDMEITRSTEGMGAPGYRVRRTEMEESGRGSWNFQDSWISVLRIDVFLFFLAKPRGMQYLSSPTRD